MPRSQLSSNHRAVQRRPLNRRTFLAASAAAASTLFAAPRIIRARSLNEKLNIAMIGCGGRGGKNLQEVRDENIVALCDVDEPKINAARGIAPDAKAYRDFRK